MHHIPRAWIQEQYGRFIFFPVMAWQRFVGKFFDPSGQDMENWARSFKILNPPSLVEGVI
jgi:hypothetical protein